MIFLSPLEVKRFEEEYIGKVCNNKCQGNKAYIQDGVLHDCECSIACVRAIRLTNAGIPKRYWDFSFNDLIKISKRTMLCP